MIEKKKRKERKRLKRIQSFYWSSGTELLPVGRCHILASI